MRLRLSTYALFVASLTGMACSSSTSAPDGTASRTDATNIELSRTSIVAEAGDTVRLRAHVRQSNGAEGSASQVRWRVADAHVALVEDGLVVPLVEGKTQVTASVGSASAAAPVSVWGSTTAVELAAQPEALTVAAGRTVLAATTLTFSNGAGVQLRKSVSWRVLDPRVATVEDGQVKGVSAGSTKLVASVGELSDTVSITVTSAATLQLSSDSVSLEAGRTATLTPSLSDGADVSTLGTLTWTSSDHAVATVSSSGVVTAVAPGTAMVQAAVGTLAALTKVVVTAAPAVAPTPAPGTIVSDVVELPREYLATDALPVAGRTVRVPAGADLQAALDAAQPGDELVLDAGATYTGTLVLRNKSGAGWITLRSSGTLPAPRTRVTPSAAPQLARLVAASAAQPVIKTEAGAHHYRLIGLEVTAVAGATTGYTLVSLGDASSAQNTIEKQPHHLVLDRVYIHGTPTLNFQRCVALNSAATAIIDSWLSECHGKGMDSQAIGGWNGTGPYKIVNNRLEGAGENVMFGGADPHIPNALPRDIEIRRNHFIKPAEWKGVWSVKNLLELKIGQRVLVEGNVFENSWLDAQTGFALNFKSTNQSGTAPWSQTSDVTVRDNVIRNTAHGVSLAAKPESNPAVPAARFRFENNVFERIGTGDYPGGHLFQIGGIDDLQLVHNTAVSSHSAMILTQGWAPMQRLIVRDNIFAGTRYGISGDGAGSGTAALTTRAAPGWRFSGNVISGARASDYPGGNFFPSSLSAIGFVNVAGGDLRLGATSSFVGVLTDGGTPGADFARLTAATAGALAH